MKPSLLFIILLIQSAFAVAQLDDKISLEYQVHTVSVISSCNKSGSGVIVHQSGKKYIVATAKHLFDDPKDPVCATEATIKLYPSEEVKHCDIVYLDPDSLIDFALIAFESVDLNMSQLQFDGSHDLNDQFHLVSTLEEWRIIPPPSRKSTLLAINIARTKAKLYMEGIVEGHSGSGYFTRDGLAGIIYYQEGSSNTVRTITINYIEEKLRTSGLLTK